MNDYEIRRSARKTIGLSIGYGGALVVKAPFFVSRREIEAAVGSKRNWIDQKQAEMMKHKEKYPTISFEDGQVVYYLGQSYQIAIQTGVQESFMQANKIFLPLKKEHREQALKSWYKKNASEIFRKRAVYFQRQTGLNVAAVKITDAKRQWGSCSRQGNINFSWRLAMCPPEIIDYVVLHEVIHLKHPNHSKDFYNMVEHYMSDYRARKKWLSDNRCIIDMVL